MTCAFSRSAHDLAAARLGQRVNEYDVRGDGDGADLRAHMFLERIGQFVIALHAGVQNAEGVDDVTAQVIGHADGRGLRHERDG